MKIVKIKRGKKHSALLSLDSGETLEIDLSAIEESHIHEGDELSEEDTQKLKALSDYNRAKSRALWLLDYADQTETCLLDKLKRAGFDEKTAKKAINRLKSLDLINDDRFAERYALKCAQSGISKNQTYIKLISKKLDRETVKSAISKVEFDEEAAIEKLIEKKYHKNLELNDRKETQKVIAALARKGFSFSDIKSALSKFTDEMSQEEEFY